jgi:molybdate transport system substrate-binding protein
MRALAIAVAASLVVSCSSDDGATGDAVDLTVFAAASLSAAFTEIGDVFLAANPGAELRFNFAGSSELAAQIGEGAPADVYASADLANMAKLVAVGAAATDPVVFATNRAAIIVEPGNPEGITELGDLTDDDLVVVQCAPEVPCGAYALEIFANAGVDVTPKSYEANVNAVVTKITLGEADAGIVYRTDVLAAGDAADGVAIPVDVNVLAEYPIVVTESSPDPAGAGAFVEAVRSAAGRDILEDYGFGAP